MPGALEGVRVVDFGQYIAGPLAAVMLADQGADVIHVDPPGGPRWKYRCRRLPQPRQAADRARSQDSRTTSAAAQRLIDGADVLIENFRPGVMERLGLGADAMRARNPRLIYCSMPGFAADDPRAGMRGLGGHRRRGDRQLPGRASARRRRTGTPPAPTYSAIPLASNFARVPGRHQHRDGADRAAAHRAGPAHRGAAVRRHVHADRPGRRLRRRSAACSHPDGINGRGAGASAAATAVHPVRPVQARGS